MLIGYARVSTGDQSLALQIDALKAAGCEMVFEDQMTGASVVRPGLEKAFSHLRKGDTLVVWKLDRLGRTVKGLVEMVEVLQGKGVEFRSLTDSIDTSTSAGRFFFHVMAALAQMERELVRERTQAGLSAARARGRVGGRKAKVDESKKKAAKRMLESGMTATEVARTIGVSRATLYRSLRAV